MDGHIVEVLARSADLRGFELRPVPTRRSRGARRVRVESVRDTDWRVGWFLVETGATT